MKSTSRTRLSLESLEARTVPAFVASLVADVNPGAGSGGPFGLIQFNGAAYFKADDGVHGVELWKTDGTPAGTGMVKDINPGSAGSLNGYYFTEMNGRLYFMADDGVHGYELWCTDGTEAGTVMVADINPGAGSSNPQGHIVNDPAPPYERMGVINNNLYFSADDGVHGRELWRSDGIPGGVTTQVTNFTPAAAIGLYMAQLNGALYFAADDGVHGMELWKTDGATTAILKDINPGSGSSNDYYLCASNGLVYFQADDGAHGREMWRTDGTTAGTFLLKDIATNSGHNIGSSVPGFATSIVVNNVPTTLFRTMGGYGLWKTNGTTAGTVQVTGLNPSGAAYLVAMGGAAYFSADDGSHGLELWKSDGTAAGTVMLTDYPGKTTGTPNGTVPTNITSVNGRLFFNGLSSANGNDLWTSDGTVAGTYSIDVNPGAASSNPSGFIGLNGTVLFAATDAIHGTELWRLDQTAGPMNEPPSSGGHQSDSIGSLHAKQLRSEPESQQETRSSVRHSPSLLIDLAATDLSPIFVGRKPNDAADALTRMPLRLTSEEAFAEFARSIVEL